MSRCTQGDWNENGPTIIRVVCTTWHTLDTPSDTCTPAVVAQKLLATSRAKTDPPRRHVRQHHARVLGELLLGRRRAGAECVAGRGQQVQGGAAGRAFECVELQALSQPVTTRRSAYTGRSCKSHTLTYYICLSFYLVSLLLSKFVVRRATLRAFLTNDLIS